MMRSGLLLTAKLVGRLAVSLAAFLAGLAAAELSAPRSQRPPARCEAASGSPREAATGASDVARSWATPTPTPSFTTSLPDLQLSPEALRAAWQMSATPGLMRPVVYGAGDVQRPCVCVHLGETENR